MTPQELIDLKGYGSAEKHLRRRGKWKLTKEERLDIAIEGLLSSVEDAHGHAYDVEKILNEEEVTQ